MTLNAPINIDLVILLFSREKSDYDVPLLSPHTNTQKKMGF